MHKIASIVPRLIIIGAESNGKDYEPTVRQLSKLFELAIVGKEYTTWSSAYADTHRACNYLDYGGLFNAVCDLMGEVPFTGVVTLDRDADVTMQRVSSKLGLADTSGFGYPLQANALPESTTIVDRDSGCVVGSWQVPIGTCLDSDDGRFEKLLNLSQYDGVQLISAEQEVLCQGLSPVLASHAVDALPIDVAVHVTRWALDSSARSLLGSGDRK